VSQWLAAGSSAFVLFASGLRNRMALSTPRAQRPGSEHLLQSFDKGIGT
jgi:hypothetical protein